MLLIHMINNSVTVRDPVFKATSSPASAADLTGQSMAGSRRKHYREVYFGGLRCVTQTLLLAFILFLHLSFQNIRKTYQFTP